MARPIRWRAIIFFYVKVVAVIAGVIVAVRLGLVREDQALHDDPVDLIIRSLRAGNGRSALRPSPETDAVMALMARSTRHSVDDHQRHASKEDGSGRPLAGTGCAFVTLWTGADKHRVHLQLEPHGKAWRVAEASASRRCRCATISGPCALEPGGAP
jgi:hypothetical protein